MPLYVTDKDKLRATMAVKKLVMYLAAKHPGVTFTHQETEGDTNKVDHRVYADSVLWALVEVKGRDQRSDTYATWDLDKSKVDTLLERSRRLNVRPLLVFSWLNAKFYMQVSHSNYPTVIGERHDRDDDNDNDVKVQIPFTEFTRI